MPRGDGTGPVGQGPMTGRGMGFCAGYPAAGYANSQWGFFGAGRGGRPWGGGRGRVWGGGRGFGRWPAYGYNSRNPEEEKKLVSDEIKELEAEIEGLKKYLVELDKEQKNLGQK